MNGVAAYGVIPTSTARSQPGRSANGTAPTCSTARLATSADQRAGSQLGSYGPTSSNDRPASATASSSPISIRPVIRPTSPTTGPGSAAAAAGMGRSSTSA